MCLYCVFIIAVLFSLFFNVPISEAWLLMTSVPSQTGVSDVGVLHFCVTFYLRLPFAQTVLRNVEVKI